jgi:HK97 family phage prohead protease
MSETTFNTLSNDISVGVAFEKIDAENRTVSGFATLDNVDAHGEIIDSSASIEAFKKFRGGLREMHTNNAVGTVVKFEEAKKYHDGEDKLYTGVYITARVSKGAQDTWEKVLDGTYKGFSIGGKIKKKELEKSEDGKVRNVIKDYDLLEVSLVDNPANPLAMVMTVRKIGDTFVYSDIEKAEPGSLSTGDFVSWNSSGGRARGKITRISSSSTLNVPDSSFSVEGTPENPAALIRLYRNGQPTDTIVGHRFSALTKIDPIEKSQYNILYNTNTGDVVLTESDDMDGFINIGWSEGEPSVEKIKNAINAYKTSQEEESDDEEITLVLHKSDVLKALAQTINSKEVLDMATDIEKDATDEVVIDETVEKSADDVTEEAAEEVVEAEAAAEDVEEGDDEVVAEEEEVEGDDAEDVEKSEDETLAPEAIVSKVQDVVTEAVAKAVDVAVESKNAVESVKASFDETVDTLNKEVSGLKDILESLTNRLKAVESETAVRKSSDILKDEEGDDEEDNSFWRGSGFLSATDLIKG